MRAVEPDRKQLAPEAVQLLEEAILQADLLAGRCIVGELAAEYGYDALIFEAFEPILTALGERMKRQEASLAQSYVASMMMDEVLRLYEAAPIPGREGLSRKGPIVLANIEDDCHPLGRKIVSAFLRVHQWEVYDLGIDVEAKTIVEQALNVGARVIGVSAMIFTTAENIRKVRREINDRGFENRIKLAVGGAVFRLRPELAAQVGADGTAPNAFSALILFEELWQQATERNIHEQ
jgi:methylmalonyl-CoA mutase cobalamin-binding domain/chain